MKRVLIVVAILAAGPKAWSQETVMATIEGPGEYTMSGSTECRGEATSTIQPGERFIARELSDGEQDWEVYLKSGISGTIPRNRIRVLPDEPLARLNFASCKKKWRKLQSKRIKMTDDVASSAKKYYGVANYYKTLVQASEGDAKAFGQFSSLDMDGVALSLAWRSVNLKPNRPGFASQLGILSGFRADRLRRHQQNDKTNA
jgi:hypothetical protein